MKKEANYLNNSKTFFVNVVVKQLLLKIKL